MKKYSISFAALLLSCVALAQPGRKETNLSKWQFSHDQLSWQEVTIPHDWAIAGPFDKKHDLQVVAIEQNGETEKSEKSGRSGALPWMGKGYYKKTLHLDSRPEHAELLFDGAMSEPRVIVNGTEAIYWPYGYNAFRADVTSLLRQGDNLVEVHLQNLEESSRWYPGAGLYRPVSLIITGKAHIDDWGTYFHTLQADGLQADIDVTTVVEGISDGETLAVEVSLSDESGHVVAADHQDVAANLPEIHSALFVKKPRLWSPEQPALYTLTTTLLRNHQPIDKVSRKVGIKTVSVSAENGFCLNGQSRKLKGVCLHHDLGPLGAAVNKAALIRQVRILKDMGCDAIRTSHNMPSDMQMQVYDSLGMMVMPESFDMWIYPKCKNGYARFFKEWSDRDISNLVLRNRNHASVVMWSIGNEIPEQGMQGGTDIARHLQDICHSLDPQTPVTQGMDRAEAALKTGFAQVMDVPGFNYRVHKYDNNMKQLPQGFLLGSETGSTVSSRGVYKFPVTISDHATYSDGQCSSYDVEYCSWSNLPDDDFLMQDNRSYTIGQFVWTGFDYLGEPTPYDGYWPSRSSYFGICDLAGLPKDRYYLYRSQWNTGDHTLHVLPHWTWPGREGKTTPVYVYTDYPRAELFVNGKSMGVRTFRKPEGEVVLSAPHPELLDRYRLRWNDVTYQPGELRVVAYDDNGQVAAEQTVRTAGKAQTIRLEADRTTLRADGNDLAFITVSLADAQGTMLPAATDRMTCRVSGAGSYKAACNGDATSLVPFTAATMPLFSGQLVFIVQAADHPGDIRVEITDEDNPGLKANLVLKAQ
ncbi:MAG: DUF4982 domain-containing protein [Prevotella sp.]|nr:DUF4982 domain-containing protein [Prevotella sp.]